jgi:hypothetical protein
MDLIQIETLETYIQDFDILWNTIAILKKQALVFFIGGLEIQIKNLVKMFEPKALKQAYNLAHLQENIIFYRCTHFNPSKYTPLKP